MIEAKSTQLNPQQRQFYQDQGYYFPVLVFSDEEVAAFRTKFLQYVDTNRDQLSKTAVRSQSSLFMETHVVLPWVYQIVSHPNVLDAVEGILGPNLIVWSTGWFAKMPGEKKYVSWHQDGAYWGLRPPNVCTAWVALSESTQHNGGLRVIPQTHQGQPLEQVETYAPDNMLSRGQEIATEVDESKAVDIALQPGEMSLHHIGLVHGSKANVSDKPRIGIAVRYITPEVVQDVPLRQLAHLVRGKDDYGHFELIPPPSDNLEAGWAAHAEALRRLRLNIMPKQAS